MRLPKGLSNLRLVLKEGHYDNTTIDVTVDIDNIKYADLAKELTDNIQEYIEAKGERFFAGMRKCYI